MPLVPKKLVEVAEVPVAFRKLKFWRVEEPVTRSSERLVRPPLIEPTVRAPKLALAEKRLVEEAVVAKKLVEVAEVPCAVPKVRVLRSAEVLVRLLIVPFKE